MPAGTSKAMAEPCSAGRPGLCQSWFNSGSPRKWPPNRVLARIVPLGRASETRDLAFCRKRLPRGLPNAAFSCQNGVSWPFSDRFRARWAERELTASALTSQPVSGGEPLGPKAGIRRQTGWSASAGKPDGHNLPARRFEPRRRTAIRTARNAAVQARAQKPARTSGTESAKRTLSIPACRTASLALMRRRNGERRLPNGRGSRTYPDLATEHEPFAKQRRRTLAR